VALLDTGLGSMILVPDFAHRALVVSREAPVALVDVMSGVTASRRSGRATLQVGRSRWTIEQVALVRPPVLDVLDKPADLILGAAVFRDSSLVLDFERRELYLVDRLRARPKTSTLAP
jgi:hypothetical protein